LLQNDTQICECFYGVLLMIHAFGTVHRSVPASQLSLKDLRVSRSNYRTVLSRRKRLRKQELANDLFRMNESGRAVNGEATMEDGALEARVRLRGATPSFRDVVQEWAREQDLLWQPHPQGKAVDGKPVFVLGGRISMYLDQNVAYALLPDPKAKIGGTKQWQPTSLEQLAHLVQAADASSARERTQ
jgi:hypothetical protein